MEIENLTDIISAPKGSVGELVDQLVKKGYEFDHALKIVHKYMFLDHPQNSPTTWMDEYTGPHPKLLE